MNLEFGRAVACRVTAVAAAFACSVLSLRLFSQHLSPSIYGIILVASQILAYLPLLDGGFRTVTSRRLLAERDGGKRRELLNFSQTFYSWFGAVALGAAAISMLLYSVLSAARIEHQGGLFLAMGVVGALSIYSSAQIGLLVGLQAQAQAYLLNAAASVVALGALWLAFQGGAGVWALPISGLASTLVSLPLAVGLIKRRDSAIKMLRFGFGSEFWALFRELKAEAFACFRTQINVLFLYSLDLIIVGILCTPQVLAVYGVLSRLLNVLRSVLQSLSEVFWPVVAQHGLVHEGFNTFLMRINAWAYGSVAGALSLTLLPFCRWYLGEAWTAPASLFYLLLARFLISGLSAPSNYALYGLGEFRVINRYVERELIAAVATSVFLGSLYGSHGVAAGFLAASLAGTGLALIHAYSLRTNESAFANLWRVWSRALAGFGFSFCGALLFLSWFSDGVWLLIAGMVGALMGMAGGMVFAGIRRWLRPSSEFVTNPLRQLLRQI
jgi:O-antigen/teichoic acid export membrane protein